MRLVDADALMKSLTGVEVEWYIADDGTIGDTYDTSNVVDIIQEQPTIEAEPVRQGRWVDRYGGKYANPLYVCSECKKKALYDFTRDELGHEHVVQVLSAACPHCGAKMDVDAPTKSLSPEGQKLYDTLLTRVKMDGGTDSGR